VRLMDDIDVAPPSALAAHSTRPRSFFLSIRSHSISLPALQGAGSSPETWVTNISDPPVHGNQRWARRE